MIEAERMADQEARIELRRLETGCAEALRQRARRVCATVSDWSASSMVPVVTMTRFPPPATPPGAR